MQTLKCLEEVLHQKEQALIQYMNACVKHRTTRIPKQRHFCRFGKAEEKHITVILDQVATFSEDADMLDKCPDIVYVSQHSIKFNRVGLPLHTITIFSYMQFVKCRIRAIKQ